MSGVKPLPLALAELPMSAVDREIEAYFNAAAESANPEKTAPHEFPLVSTRTLREWLLTGLSKSYGGSVTSDTIATSVIVRTAVMDALINQLDDSLTKLTRMTSATVSDTVLHADHPLVLQALGDRRLAPGEAVVMAFPDWFKDGVTEQDKRADCLMGVVRWGDRLLCRPTILDLPGVAARLTALEAEAGDTTSPNVPYHQRMGMH
jgi:hypothetical protein